MKKRRLVFADDLEGLSIFVSCMLVGTEPEKLASCLCVLFRSFSKPLRYLFPKLFRCFAREGEVEFLCETIDYLIAEAGYGIIHLIAYVAVPLIIDDFFYCFPYLLGEEPTHILRTKVIEGKFLRYCLYIVEVISSIDILL